MLKHAHRPMPDDHPEDPEYGPFWKRHRELDNMLSSAFMFLPERFRLPRYIRDPIAVQANLNLHAAVVCLHNAACEKADKFNLPGIKQTSRTRALTAAQEIVDIIKMTSHLKAGYRSPLMALGLYLAASAYTSQAKENPEECNNANLEILAKCMAAIGRQHVLTRAYLNQLLLDIERNGIPASIDLLSLRTAEKSTGHGIPLVARSAVSRHSKPVPPLPGRLPLGIAQEPPCLAPSSMAVPSSSFVGPYPTPEDAGAPASKRMRTDASRSSGVALSSEAAGASIPSLSVWSTGVAGPSPLHGSPANPLFGYPGGWSYTTRYTTTLPHRTGSPATAMADILPDLADYHMADSAEQSRAEATTFTRIPGSGPSTAGLGDDSDPVGNSNNNNNSSNNGNNPSSGMPDLDVFQNLGEWGVTDPESFYAMLGSILDSDDLGTSQSSVDPWAPLNSGAGSSSAGGSWNQAGGAASG
ncbi:hypothetical protein VTK56DRAFT_2338 [Thermocarpiscus australiensis]